MSYAEKRNFKPTSPLNPLEDHGSGDRHKAHYPSNHHGHGNGKDKGEQLGCVDSAVLDDQVQVNKRIQTLEREVRVLTRKLKRSEKDRVHLEKSHDAREEVLHHVVQELQTAKAEKEQQNQELNAALHRLQMMQSQLVHAEKMSALGILVAGIAHEINNPITFVHGNIDCASQYITDLVDLIQLYQKYHPSPHAHVVQKQQEIDVEFLLGDVSSLLNSMRMGSDRIREIVLSLRTFSHHDESELKAIDIHEGIESTLMILHHRLKENGCEPAIEVVRDYGSLPPLSCYPGKINQVFMNILSNAIDAIRDRSQELMAQENPQPDERSLALSQPWPEEWPRIWIHTGLTPQNTAFICIGNNGPLIPESLRKRIFEPFFTTKEIGKGTGLGLSISYQIIVEKHQGNLSCSSSPETGVEFLIEIPLV